MRLKVDLTFQTVVFFFFFFKFGFPFSFGCRIEPTSGYIIKNFTLSSSCSKPNPGNNQCGKKLQHQDQKHWNWFRQAERGLVVSEHTRSRHLPVGFARLYGIRSGVLLISAREKRKKNTYITIYFELLGVSCWRHAAELTDHLWQNRWDGDTWLPSKWGPQW